MMEKRIRSVRAFGAQPLFRGVGDYTGMLQESLVLHQRLGYSEVYRDWLELRHQLEFFAQMTSTRAAMRSVNEIYEIWCFLEIRQILKELGFVERPSDRVRWQSRGVERQIENGASFSFDAPGLFVRLSHEPTFGKKSLGLRSFTVSQRPDIVLEVEALGAEAKRLVWIFDAKYRLKNSTDDSQGRDLDRSGEWLVPPDALDQMHRYRDSIILNLDQQKSRPVVSAFALFPGPFDQLLPQEQNPYWADIQEVGIGAFPLLPQDHGHEWLKAYFRQTFQPLADWELGSVLGKESVRIPVTGLTYQEEDLLFLPAERMEGGASHESIKDGTAESLGLPSGFHPDARRLAKVTWIAIAFPEQGHRIIHGAYHLGNGWPRDGGPVQLTQYLATIRAVRVPWQPGPWFRYSDLRSLLATE